MKKLITLLLAIAMIGGASWAKNFTIKGNIDGVENGKAELILRESGKMVTKFSTGVKDGKFTLNGKIIEPDIYYLKVSNARGYIQLFMDNYKMKVTGSADAIRDVKITGSATQDVMTKFNQLSANLAEKYKPITSAYTEARKNKDEAKQKELEPELDKMYDAQSKLAMDYIKDNIKSPVALWMLYSRSYQIDDPAELENLLAAAPSSLADYKYVGLLKDILQTKKLTAIGQVAPDFTMNDPDGNPVSLSSFKGKYVLVDFWAAWCGPCRGENPNVVAAYKKYHKKGFTVFGVSLDRKKEDWLKAIEDDGLTWTHVSDLAYWNNAAAKQYGIRAIPANLLLDKKGVIVAKNIRGEELLKTLAKTVK